MAFSTSRRSLLSLVPVYLTIASCVVLLEARAWAADEPPAAAPAATPEARPTAVADTTQMIGSLPPEAVGRWVFVIRATTDVGASATVSQDTTDDSGKTTTVTRSQVGDSTVPIVRTLQISGKDAQATLDLHRGPFPEDLQKRILPAGPGAAGAATPGLLPVVDPKSLAEVERHWSELAKPGDAPRALTSKLLDYRAVSEADKQRLGVPSAQLLIVTDESFDGGKSLLKNVSTFAVEQMTPQRLEGQFLGAMIMPPLKSGNMAIPPVPLVLKGRFVAYNLDAVAGSAGKAAPRTDAGGSGSPAATSSTSGAAAHSSGSLTERVLGMFSGCGGR